MSIIRQPEEVEDFNEMVAMMGSIALFDKIATVQLRLIAAHMKIVYLKKEERLFSEGGKSDCMYFVVSGTLDVLKLSEKKKWVSVASLSRGRTIGEMAILDAFPRSASVVARTPSTLLSFTREGFEYILEHHPRAGISFLKGIARVLSLHLRRASGQLADFS
ncbi:MAG: cyclic nucleotide-binding domain-containing protein [Mariprofundus sp.]|nr:cyclic nucleotide-binding domain-containing protein [Mariprofundus sp.]